MNDMTSVIVPKSDQINADDLIGGDMLITIRDVKITGGQEQPVSIYFDGSDKAFRPCKSMSRVLVAAWGPDAKAYVGRSLQLYRDPTVKWGGMEVGGIRIRAMTDIQRDMTMALTATKGSRKPYTVKPLAIAAQQKAGSAPDPAVKWADAYITKVAGITEAGALEAFAAEKAGKLAELRAARPELHAQVSAVLEVRRSELAPAATSFEDDFDISPQPAADESPHVEAEPEPEVAATSASRGTLQARMERVAKGTAHQPEGRDDSDMGEFDPIRATADRLISDARDGVVRNAVDQGHYDALPDDMRAEVDAAAQGEG